MLILFFPGLNFVWVSMKLSWINECSFCPLISDVFNDLKGWSSIFNTPSLENEEFASRIINSSKYKIIFFPDLEFHHKFKPSLKLLKTIF